MVQITGFHAPFPPPTRGVSNWNFTRSGKWMPCPTLFSLVALPSLQDHEASCLAPRGSSGCSLVLFLLGLTEVDPLRYNLPFERFVRPSSNPFPDVDVDVESDRRHELISFVAEEIGRERVVHAADSFFPSPLKLLATAASLVGAPTDLPGDLAHFFRPSYGMHEIPIHSLLQLSHQSEWEYAQGADLRALYLSNDDVRRTLDVAQGLQFRAPEYLSSPATLALHDNSIRGNLATAPSDDVLLQATQWDALDLEASGFPTLDLFNVRSLSVVARVLKALDISHNAAMSTAFRDADTMLAFRLGLSVGIPGLESRIARGASW